MFAEKSFSEKWDIDFADLSEEKYVGRGVEKAVNRTFEILNNSFSLEFFECSDVMFECASSNTHSFNRLYGCLETEENASWIRNRKTGETFFLRTGCFYLIGSQIELEFSFRPQTHFLAFHFSLNMFHYQEALGSRDIFREISGRERETQRLYELLYIRTFSLKELCEFQSLFLGVLAEPLTEIRIRRHQKNDTKYRKLLAYLNREADAQTSVEDLASLTGCSRDLLSRNFSRDFGIPLKRYMQKTLVAKAEKLLRNPSLKIREIAFRLGFSDEYYFSRFFRKETGNSPSFFRRILKLQ